MRTSTAETLGIMDARRRRAPRPSIRRLVWMAGAAVTLALAGSVTHFPASAQDAGPAARPVPAPTVHVTDLTPRFLTFFETAQGLDADARFDVWRQTYGFAAVPPTPQGEAMARSLLDTAFERYPSVMPRIEAGAGGMGIDPGAAASEVAVLLGVDQPIEIDFIAFVGGFEQNAFTFRARRPTVAVPVEADPAYQALAGRHEIVHALHMEMAGLSGGWERSIAQLVLQEGLAMRATQALMPDRPDLEHLSAGPEWWARANERRREILIGTLPLLSASDGASVTRLSMGPGVAGLRREAYYLGWIVVGRLLGEGWTFPALARVSSEDMPDLIRGAIERELAVS